MAEWNDAKRRLLFAALMRRNSTSCATQRLIHSFAFKCSCVFVILGLLLLTVIVIVFRQGNNQILSRVLQQAQANGLPCAPETTFRNDGDSLPRRIASIPQGCKLNLRNYLDTITLRSSCSSRHCSAFAMPPQTAEAPPHPQSSSIYAHPSIPLLQLCKTPG